MSDNNIMRKHGKTFVWAITGIFSAYLAFMPPFTGSEYSFSRLIVVTAVFLLLSASIFNLLRMSLFYVSAGTKTRALSSAINNLLAVSCLDENRCIKCK